ncbi:hypothetical protein B5D80_03770 [Micromonospora wenchangensis]|uniref:PLAT domain-containing protein n=1 Tax=Micromonospora wenchangensis TaxID=1185415 RepID=A0A246RU04_9ACTN|nr:hypothetical protein B5D80_03770 [Micromonospora wenchangensis]
MTWTGFGFHRSTFAISGQELGRVEFEPIFGVEHCLEALARIPKTLGSNFPAEMPKLFLTSYRVVMSSGLQFRSMVSKQVWLTLTSA